MPLPPAFPPPLKKKFKEKNGYDGFYCKLFSIQQINLLQRKPGTNISKQNKKCKKGYI